MQRGRFRIVLVTVLGVAIAAACGVGYTRIAAYYLHQGEERAATSLRLTVLGLEGLLQRFRAAPDLLAQDPRLSALLARPTDAAALADANRWLAEQAALIDAGEVFLLDRAGLAVAASNHMRPDAFPGQGFALQPYVRDGLTGINSQFFGLGSPTGSRGFYFAAPVFGPPGQVAGLVVVKINLDEIEAEWRRADEIIAVSDPDGIVFLSTASGWLFQSLAPLPAERWQAIRAGGRYGDLPGGDLGLTRREVGGVTVLQLTPPGKSPADFVAARRFMALADWSVTVLLPTAPFLWQARLAAAAAFLMFALAGAAALVVLQRRARLADRIAITERNRAELEGRVRERTADLARLNAALAGEVAERTATEQVLRQTQTDLIQAGKLAALGQMSAALSHEINQPLAAVRNYADSAAVLIDRGEAARAKGNLDQILALVDRMAAIARHLRHVARKPDRPLTDVSVSQAVADALAMAAPRLLAAATEVDMCLPPDLPRVKAGPVRLTQVLVNLISNAADAVQGLSDRQIVLDAHHAGSRVLLSVSDSGPGVPKAIADRIFDPFFTTKSVGAGLGLGLSISYNIAKDFGGDLRVQPGPMGGAMFILELAAVP